MDTEKVDKKGFFRKYFWEGQHLNENSSSQEIASDADLVDVVLIKYRKYVAVLIPIVVMQTFWWLTAIRYSWLSLYATHWHLPAIMLLGSTVAGMTSEGGGAVAFPVMTLGLKIPPTVARDFSLVVQAIGMSCALFVIVFMNVQIEKRAVIFSIMGSVPGFVFGCVAVDPLLTAPAKKMLFVSIWSSFAIALYMLNDEKRRKTYLVIPAFKPWKALVLACTGFIGGIFTAFAGSGVDVCIFSIITLLFRVSEKTATPTTIVLMGMNSVIGVYYRSVWQGEISPLALDYVKVTVPIAVTLAPIGSFIGSHFHRKVLASFIYVLEGLAVIGFLATGPPPELVVIGAGILAIAFAFFLLISRAGSNMMKNIENMKRANDTEQMLATKSTFMNGDGELPLAVSSQ